MSRTLLSKSVYSHYPGQRRVSKDFYVQFVAKSQEKNARQFCERQFSSFLERWPLQNVASTAWSILATRVMYSLEPGIYILCHSPSLGGGKEGLCTVASVQSYPRDIIEKLANDFIASTRASRRSSPSSVVIIRGTIVCIVFMYMCMAVLARFSIVVHFEI